MKKFLGVLVALTMCICFVVPCAFAADTSDSSLGELASLLQNGGASLDELNALLQNEDLMAAFEDSDIASLFGDASSGDASAIEEIENAVAQIEEKVTVPDDVSNMLDSFLNAANSADTTVASATQSVTVEDTSTAILASILTPLSSVMDVAPFEELLSGVSESDITSILALVSSVMGSSGIDLTSFTSLDLGKFDIANLASGLGNPSISNLAESATDVTATIADTLMSALSSLGLDTKTIEGLLDNEIVNFFANMYIGFIGKTEEAPTDATTTTVPAVVTTTTPKTGDTSSVFVAIATLFVAGTAAGVCLKKKEDA